MANILRVRMASSGWQGAPGLNTFYFQNFAGDGTLDVSMAQLAADRVRNAFAPTFVTFPSGWAAVVSPTVDVLDPVTGSLVDSLSVTPPAALAGTSTAGFAPLPVMLLLRLNTSTFSSGSRLQGRAFIGPIALADDTNGTPTGAQQTAVQAIGDGLLAVGVSGNPKLVVWRRPRKADPLRPLITARPGSTGVVTSTTAPDKFAVLRSRRD